jgi:hypothetical protein
MSQLNTAIYRGLCLSPEKPQHGHEVPSHAGLFPCNDMVPTRRPASALLSRLAVAYLIYTIDYHSIYTTENNRLVLPSPYPWIDMKSQKEKKTPTNAVVVS